MSIAAALIAELFHHAARSPSAHNTQPWVPRYVPANTPGSPAEVHVVVDPARTLPIGDPNSEDLHLAMGCWVESFAIAAAEVGLHVIISSVRGRGPALEIRLLLTTGQGLSTAPTQAHSRSPCPSASWPTFTSADLHHRQVDRGPMVGAEESFAAAFASASRALETSSVRLVEVPHELWTRALARATRYSYSHSEIFTETLEWLRFDRRNPSYDEDGLNADCLQIPRPVAALASRLNTVALRPWIGTLTSAALAPFELVDTKRASVGRRAPGHAGADADDRRLTRRGSGAGSAERSPSLHHLVLARDDKLTSKTGPRAEAEIELGRNLLRVWLLLDRYGLRVDVHSEIKDCPKTRAFVRQHLQAHGLDATPVAAFSVGRSTTAVPRSHRRPVDPTLT